MRCGRQDISCLTNNGSTYVLSVFQCMHSSNIDQTCIILQRILFLETIAGVPGMVAATLRHLTSLRLMVNIFGVQLILESTNLSISAVIVAGTSLIVLPLITHS